MMRRAGWLMVLAASLCPAAFSQALSQLNCGTVVSGSFSQGPTDFYIIQTDPGDAILVRLVSTSGDPALVPKIQVTTHQPHVDRTAGSLTAGADVAAEFDLPAGGPHQIRILAATDAAQGAYRLTFVFLNKPCALATLNCGVGVRGQFASPLETRTYQFQAQAGDVLSARAFRADPGLTASVAVYSSGKLLMSGNRPLLGQSSGGATRVDFLVGESATLIFVLFEASNRTGNYRLRDYPPEPPLWNRYGLLRRDHTIVDCQPIQCRFLLDGGGPGGCHLIPRQRPRAAAWSPFWKPTTRREMPCP